MGSIGVTGWGSEVIGKTPSIVDLHMSRLAICELATRITLI